MGKPVLPNLGFHINGSSKSGLPEGVLFFHIRVTVAAAQGGLKDLYLVNYLTGHNIDSLVQRRGWFSYGYYEPDRWQYEGPAP